MKPATLCLAALVLPLIGAAIGQIAAIGLNVWTIQIAAELAALIN